jgi:RND family efflux transporter MFP subunit
MWAILVAILAALTSAAVRHHHRSSVAASAARARAAPLMRLHVQQLAVKHAAVELELPGTIAPLETAALNARATGYVVEREVDIGSVVKEGQLLAVISSEELQQEVSQASAGMAQARANLSLAQANAARSQELIREQAITQLQWDRDRLAQAAREAELHAAQASSATVKQRRRYLRVVSPFDGVVTARNVEVGDLVRADDAGLRPLFVVARMVVARVQVNVPQDAANDVHVGDETSVKIQELPKQRFVGRVTRTAQALDPSSRTLLTEIEIDNKAGLLKAGAYARIRFASLGQRTTVRIPAEALIYDERGLLVAIANGDKVQLKPVAVGRDDGTHIEVSEGLTGNERVVINPPSSLTETTQVQFVDDHPDGAK